MRAELAGERPHRLVLRAGGDPQGAIALGARFRDQLPEQDAADAVPSHGRFHAEGDLRQRVRRLLRRMQFRRAAHHAVLDIGDDDGAIVGAFRGVTLDKAVIHEAVEAIVAAGPIEPQQMIAQQRQFFLLAQRPDVALGEASNGSMSSWRTSKLLLESPRGGVESLDHRYCASQHEIQGRDAASNIGNVAALMVNRSHNSDLIRAPSASGSPPRPACRLRSPAASARPGCAVPDAPASRSQSRSFPPWRRR